MSVLFVVYFNELLMAIFINLLPIILKSNVYFIQSYSLTPANLYTCMALLIQLIVYEISDSSTETRMYLSSVLPREQEWFVSFHIFKIGRNTWVLKHICSEVLPIKNQGAVHMHVHIHICINIYALVFINMAPVYMYVSKAVYLNVLVYIMIRMLFAYLHLVFIKP